MGGGVPEVHGSIRHCYMGLHQDLTGGYLSQPNHLAKTRAASHEHPDSHLLSTGPCAIQTFPLSASYKFSAFEQCVCVLLQSM